MMNNMKYISFSNNLDLLNPKIKIKDVKKIIRA